MTKLEIKLAAALRSAMRNGWTPAEVDGCLTALNEFDLQYDDEKFHIIDHHSKKAVDGGRKFNTVMEAVEWISNQGTHLNPNNLEIARDANH